MNNPKLKEIVARMKERDVAALIIPLTDPHMSEYIGDQWKFLEWLSGFTGSAGTLVVTMDYAGLWTDSRYFIQAEQELHGTGIQLQRYIKKEDHYANWILRHIEQGSTIALDGRMFSIAQIENLKKMLKPKNYDYKFNFKAIDSCWGAERPKPKSKKIFLFDNRYAGTPRKNKISELRKVITAASADWSLISALDEIAWLLNLRGRDIDFNPLFYAYLLIGTDDSYLFIDEEKLPEAVRRVLESEDIYIEDYDCIWQLSDIAYGKIIIDKEATSISVQDQLRSDQWIYKDSYVKHAKAVKSTIEIQHIHDAMVQDGVALSQAFYWLEQQEDGTVTEYDFSDQIMQCRKKQLGYYGESFPAIVGADDNGAIVHYRPTQESAKTIGPDSIILCDSGGQYLNGTTDITRMIAMGSVSDQFKEHYTLVLKGHIALARLTFPIGTTGGQIDLLARQALWSHGLNFGHGTGHGVGYFLNVHEGPQGISPRNQIPLKAGMLTSNEPGYYLEGSYGIRIENLILVEESEYEGFLQFRTVTYFPLRTDLVNASLLDPGEIIWLNEYNRSVYEILSPHLDEQIRGWLEHHCSTT
jgi:Xaa-Pro aminopeptidase